ncbi:hypothetical protein FS837_001349 [Tulasnella sp. UAMH 9824]|nr:hypothetical protein FS837_001349 [Tulasnella sp. UAMH 9824]
MRKAEYQGAYGAHKPCNNQISDAVDGYVRVADLDPNHQVIQAQLRLLKDVQANGGTTSTVPGLQDVQPTAYYASRHGPPSMLMGGGSGGSAQPGHQQRPQHPYGPLEEQPRSWLSNGVDHPMNGGVTRNLPAPSPSMRGGRRSAEYGQHPANEPFHGGAPPPLNIDDSPPRRGSGGHVPHVPLAPMDVDRRDNSQRYPPPEGRDRSANGLLPPPLHHPIPQAPHSWTQQHGTPTTVWKGRVALDARPAMGEEACQERFEERHVDQPGGFRPPVPPSNSPPPLSAAYPLPHAARPLSFHPYNRRVPSPHVSRAEYPERRDARSLPYSSSAPYWGSQHSPPQGHPALRWPSLPPPLPSSVLPYRRCDPTHDGEPPHRGGWDADRDVATGRHAERPTPPTSTATASATASPASRY